MNWLLLRPSAVGLDGCLSYFLPLLRRSRRPPFLRGLSPSLTLFGSPGTPPVSPLFQHVFHVIRNGPEKQMRRVHATRVVALMANVKPLRYRTPINLPGQSGGYPKPSVDLDSSVTLSLFMACPFPAPRFRVLPIPPAELLRRVLRFPCMLSGRHTIMSRYSKIPQDLR